MVEANSPTCIHCPARTWGGWKYVCDKTKLALLQQNEPSGCPQPNPINGNMQSTGSVELLLRKVLGK